MDTNVFLFDNFSFAKALNNAYEILGQDIQLNYKLVEVQKTNDYYCYNNYCNILLEDINEGYIIFLDEDDKFIHENSLKYINDYLEEERFLVWEYLRADKIIGPSKGQVKSGNITSCGFCYNSKFKSYNFVLLDGSSFFFFFFSDIHFTIDLTYW